MNDQPNDHAKKTIKDYAEEKITEAIERGEFDNLPGAGKPLNLEADRLVPQEYRLAYRIMRDNDIQPDWIALGKEIDLELEKARRELRTAAQRYFVIEAKCAGKQDVASVIKRLAAKDDRDYAKACFADQVRRINRKIALLNLKVPAAYLTRDLLEVERELAKIFPA